MADFQIVENGDGGDFVLKGNDVVFITGWQNMPYLALFGGNIANPTKEVFDGEQRFDFWGNNLFMQRDSSIQFNSNLETALMTIPLNSAGRLLMEEAAKKDLEFMKPFADVKISISMVYVDRINIELNIKELENQTEKKFVYIWDNINKEISMYYDGINQFDPYVKPPEVMGGFSSGFSGGFNT